MLDVTYSGRLSGDELDALLEIVVLVAYADGSMAGSELEHIVRRMGELSGGSVDRAWVESRIAELRPEKPLLGKARIERFHALGQRLPQPPLRRAAFKVGLEVAHADGRMGAREVTTLAAAAAELGLTAQAVLDLLAAIKAARGEA